MPTFQYVAIDRTGREITGELMADDEQAARGQVKQLGYYLTDLRSLDGGPAAAPRPLPRLFGRIRSQDLALFSRQLANLVNGGLPLLRSLDALLDSTDNERLAEAIQQVRDEVEGGSSLHEALEKPGVFPALFVSMVRAGEASGELGTVLAWLADFQEKEQEKRAQVKAAMMYPTLLVVIGSLAIFLLLTFLVPRFSLIFAELEQALPLPTVILMSLAHGLARWWWALLLGLWALRSLLRAYGATPVGRLRLDALKLRMPVWGNLIRKMAVARFARTLATLLRGGVSILEALEVVRDVLGNERLARSLDEIRQRVREGESLAAQTQASGQFPPLLIHMIALGEETGDLPGVLSTVANAYDVEVDNALKGLISLLEPTIILIMGAIVAFVVMAMLLPIFQMNVFVG
ncbi:MAG TPA: type II secretion system F family protein [Armatimonadetes bacterium]|nr:type II secretion system F family protein [Armatimonadota bacterium]